MHRPYYNDQASIAEFFVFVDEHTTQTSRLAIYKINSYKLALANMAYCATKNDLLEIINKSLLNFVSPDVVLFNVGFFNSPMEN